MLACSTGSMVGSGASGAAFAAVFDVGVDIQAGSPGAADEMVSHLTYSGYMRSQISP